MKPEAVLQFYRSKDNSFTGLQRVAIIDAAVRLMIASECSAEDAIELSRFIFLEVHKCKEVYEIAMNYIIKRKAWMKHKAVELLDELEEMCDYLDKE